MAGLEFVEMATIIFNAMNPTAELDYRAFINESLVDYVSMTAIGTVKFLL